MQKMPMRRVVLVIVPPMRFENAMLMLVELPLTEREIDSKISGISDAMGAKKKAKSVEFTSKVVASEEMALIKGSENIKIKLPPTARYPMPFQSGCSSSSSSSSSSLSECSPGKCTE